MNIKNKILIRNGEKWGIEKIFFSIWLISSIILFYCFIYNDILETMRVGISFWDELFNGNLTYFYGEKWNLTTIAYMKEVQASYDFPIYIIFAIWNFPIWLFEHFGNVDVMNSIPCLMWGKTLLLVCTILIMKAIYRLCQTLGIEDNLSKLASLLFLSSNFFVTSVIIISGYDIIALYLSIKGITYYFQKKNNKFLVCFMCAIPLKFFALLLFIPLLLLKEKRVMHIIVKCILSVSALLFFRFIIPCRAAIGDVNSATHNLQNTLKSTEVSNLAWIYAVYYKISMVIGQIYPAIMAWLILFLVCYFIKVETEKQLKYWGIYMCFISYGILFVFCMSHPYWILLIVPFIVIIIVQNEQYLYVNIFLEMILSWGMILAQIVKTPWCFGNAVVNSMLLPLFLGRQNVFEKVTPMSIIEMFAQGDNAPNYVIGIGCTVFVAVFLLFSIINMPGRKNKLPVISKDKKAIKSLIALRTFSGIVISMLPIVMYIIGLNF